MKKIWGLGLLAFLFSVSAISDGISNNNYDIYYGDVDGNGTDEFYFHGKPKLVLLHGDVIVPVQTGFFQSFWYWGSSSFGCFGGGLDDYGQPIVSCPYNEIKDGSIIDRLSDSQLAQLQKINNSDYVTADFNGDGVFELFYKGNNQQFITQGHVLYFNEVTGQISIEFLHNDNPNIVLWTSLVAEGRSYEIKDVNNDGIDDLIVYGLTPDEADVAFLSGAEGIATGSKIVFDEPDSRPVTLVGVTEGAFRVSESGAATYNQTIYTPKGTAGVTPSFSLNYSSHGGNGQLGVGWSLNGISSISRCRQSKAQDNNSLALRWGEGDKFCLNGQRLVLTNNVVYGGHLSEYKTEIDSGVTVTAYSLSAKANDPDYFKMESKDGSISWFGNSVDSRNTISNGVGYQWFITRVTDNLENSVFYSYEGGNSQRVRINRVEYAAGPQKTIASSSQVKVKFNYETRPDVLSGYVGGTHVTESNRLKSIEVTDRGSEVRSYHLSYIKSDPSLAKDPDKKISRLAALQECIDADCFEPNNFDWSILENTFADRLHANSATNSDILINDIDRVQKIVPADLDGDGLLDLVVETWEFIDDKPHEEIVRLEFRYASADGTTMQYDSVRSPRLLMERDTSSDPDTRRKWAVIDYNNDGRSDVITWKKGESSLTLYPSHYLSQFDKWGITGTKKIIDLGVPAEGSQEFADFNGDGLSDIVASGNIWLQQKDLSFSSTSSSYNYFPYLYTDPLAVTWPVYHNFSGIDYRFIREKAKTFKGFADFDKDGALDVIVYRQVTATEIDSFEDKRELEGRVVQDNGVFIASLGANNQFKHIHRIKAPNGNLTKDDNVLAVDINADGLVDIFFEKNDFWYYQLNTGDGFAPVTFFKDLTRANSESDVQPLDVNGDGYADVAYSNGNGAYYLSYWNGNSFVPHETSYNGTALVGQPFMHKLGDNSGWIITDINQDGRPDIVDIGVNRGSLRISKVSDIPHNVITSLRNGLGAKTNINYARLNNTNHYQPLGINCTSPECEFGTNPLDNFNALQLRQFALQEFYSALQDPFDSITQSNFIASALPVLQLHRQYLVVTGVNSPAPLAGEVPESINKNNLAELEYYYGQAYVQAGGRGALGFKKTGTLDKQTGVLTENEYRLDFPFTGRPVRTVVYSQNNKVISESTSEWRTYGFDSNWSETATQSGTVALAPFQPYLYQSIERKYNLETDYTEPHLFNVSEELASTTKNTFTVDAYGNNTKIVTVTESNGDKWEATTTNDFGTGIDDLEKSRVRKTTVNYKSTVDGVVKTAKRESAFNYYHGDGPAACSIGDEKMKGMLCQEIIEPDTVDSTNGTTPYRLVTTYQYDAMGNVTSTETSGDGVVTRSETNEYDSHGRYITKTYNALGHKLSEVKSRNKYGEPSEIEVLNGNTITTTFDVAGRKIKVSDSTGSWSEEELKLCSQSLCPVGASYLLEKRVAGGGKSIIFYDILARPIREGSISYDGKWVYSDTEYDYAGRILRKSEPFFETRTNKLWTENKYDHMGRVLQITAPDDSQITYEYSGFTTKSTNSKDQTALEIKNAKGELVKSIDDNESALHYTYDAQGNLETVKTSVMVAGVEQFRDELTVKMDYDLLGRKTAMHDPDKGYWQYSYNRFGELVEQTDAKGQRIANSYDILGRLYERSTFKSSGSLESYTYWHFDHTDDLGRAVADSLGSVTAVVHSTSQQDKACNAATTQYCQRYEYDQWGRANKTHSFIGSNGVEGSFSSRVTYDHLGRVQKQYDVLGSLLETEAANGNATSGVLNVYNSYGYLSQVIDLASGSEQRSIYDVLAYNERGQVSKEQLANKAITQYAYNPLNGRLERQTATSLEGFAIQDIQYKWDQIGNLTSRHNQSTNPHTNQLLNQQESFCYDNLNRLVKTVKGTTTYNCANAVSSNPDIKYDLFGNITYKKDVGNYDQYGPGKWQNGIINNSRIGIHAVTHTSDGVSYQYDANGNLINDTAGRSLTYTAFDKVSQITKGNHQVNFRYGPDRNRYERIDKNLQSGETTKTHYLGAIEKITKSSSPNIVEWKRYLPGGAIYTVTTNKASGKHRLQKTDRIVLYKDHLGSSDVMTDILGKVIHAMSFDPWGERRNPWNWNEFTASELLSYRTIMTNGIIQLGGAIQNATTRGFTGHEMLDEVGLIHMNGRIYDPRLARFVQADPVIDGVTSVQGYNRYAYLHNNPLNATDPTGFSRWREFRDGVLKPVVQIAVGIVCQYCAVALAAATSLYYGGDIGDAAFAAAMAYTFSEIGGSGLDLGVKVVLMGTLGGIQSTLAGGKFGSGFLAAGLATYAGANITPGLAAALGGDVVGAAIAGAVIGGTVSAISGGKFVNGAITGAFAAAVGYLKAKSDLKKDWQPGKTVPKNINEESVGPTRLTVNTTEIVNEDGEINRLVSISGTYDDRTSQYRTSEIVDAIERYWSGVFKGEDGITYILSTDLSKASMWQSMSAKGADITFELGSCALDFACASAWTGKITFDNFHATMNNPYAIAHEFGHVAGFSHFNNGVGNIMSYDQFTRVQAVNVELLWKKYNLD